MAELKDRLKSLRLEQSLSQQKLADKIGINKSSINMYERGEREPKLETLEIFADFYNVDMDYLVGKTESKNKNEWLKQMEPTDNQQLYILDSKKIYSVPIFENVSAGFGTTAINEIVDYIPLYIETKEEADNTICITVKGDSMSPKIDDGDLIQVRRQPTVDSGAIGVVLIDNEDALVKKIIYNQKSIDLISFNKQYQTMHFEGDDLQHIQILGLVKKVIKNI